MSGSGYLSAPYVKITGDGVGATAIATIDGSGNITGYTITNPGVNYTTATVTLVGGGGTGTAPTAGLAANTSGGLTKLNTGTLSLTGANTYTGTTTISGGTFQLGNATTTGSLSVASPISIGTAGIFQINRTNAVVQGTDFTSSATAGGGISGLGQLVITSAVAGEVVTLNGTNTYQGGTTLVTTGTSAVGGPVLVLASNGALGSGTLTLRSNGLGGADTLSLSGTGLNITNPITMDTTLGFREGINNLSTSGANILSSPITISGTTAQTLVLNNSSTTGLFTVAGNITATGGNTSNISLRGTGTTGLGLLTGTVTLNSVLDNNVGGIWTIQPATPGANTWTQTQLNSTVAGSGLKLGINNALATAADVLWGTTAIGTLDLNGFNQTVAGITSTVVTTPTITNSGATDSTLTIQGIVTSPKTFTGVIKDGATNKTNLTLNSTGSTQILTGASTYTGATTINNGTLKVLGNVIGVPVASAVTVNTGGTLTYDGNGANYSQATAPAISLNGGTLASTNTGNFFTVLSGTASNGVTVNAASAITVQSLSSNSSGFYLDGGLKGSADLAVTSSTNGAGLVLRNTASTYSGSMTINGNASSVAGTGSGLALSTNLPNASLTVNGTLELGYGNGVVTSGMGWANSGPTAATGAVGLNNATTQINALNGTGVVVANFTTLSINHTFSVGNNNGTGSFSGVIANGTNDTLSFTKNGSGTQTLSGLNTYTGATTISAGTLQIGAGGTTGSIANTSSIINNGAPCF